MGVTPDELMETAAQNQMALRRPQTPKDLGDAVAFIAKADNITGEAVMVDGGLSMS